ncbi:MAG TPA: M23 family metallopeptidase [Spirochaetia bacterium]
MSHRAVLIAIVLVVSLSAAAAHAAAPYPEVRALTNDDPLYVQLQGEISDFRRATETRVGAAPSLPPVTFFSYTKRATEDLFGLNARIGVRYDTLATLNGAPSTASFNGKSSIVVPSQDGLFVSVPPRGDLESMIYATRTADGQKPQLLQVTRAGKREPVYYFPGEAFSGVERAYFLTILYRAPIEKGQITSMYGWRADPFTGQREFHGGLDIGAREGTPVLAAREGTVDEVGKSEELGNYVVITHAGGYQTVYGHLSSINVTLHQRVMTGAAIGAVGQTGHATGPHLHFEVRTKAGTTDPLLLIRMK